MRVAGLDRKAVVEFHPLLGHPIDMTLTFIIVATIAITWLAERSLEQLRLAIAAQCFIAAVLLFAVTDLERAILLSSGGSNLRSVKRQVPSQRAETDDNRLAAGVCRNGAVFFCTVSACNNSCSRWRHRTHSSRSRGAVLRRWAASFSSNCKFFYSPSLSLV
jgi:hypothetical protein